MISRYDDELVGSTRRSDPLGFLSIWSRRARKAVPHLTEQSWHVGGFQVLVEAYRMWGHFVDKRNPSNTDLEQFFMLIEQAFARVIGGYDDVNWTLPGARRVRARRGDKVHYISIDHQEWHLLSNQLSGGIWGLYRGAAKRAGLLSVNEDRLSNETLEEAESKSLIKSKAMNELFNVVDDALKGGLGELPSDGRKRVVQALERTFKEVPLKAHLKSKLIACQPLNQLLSDRLSKDLAGEEPLEHRRILEPNAELSEYSDQLNSIIKCENLLSIIEAVFYHICQSRGKSIAESAQNLSIDMGKLRKALEEFQISSDYRNDTKSNENRLCSTLDLINKECLLESVMKLHEDVCKERDRAVWVWVELDKLDSDVIGDFSENLNFEVGSTWRNDYYLSPLRSIVRQFMELGEP